MRVVTVGTGTVVPDPERASACLWIECGDARAAIDCGSGALRAMARAGLPWGELSHLFLSHFHNDHLNDVPALLFALRHALAVPRASALQIAGPVGTRALFQRWAAALGDWLIEADFPISIAELTPDGAVPLGDGTIRVHPTPHTDESVAYRVEGPDGSLGYTGDTGPSDAVADFLAGVDLLIAECSLPDDLAIDHHLTPSRLARLARRARPGRLAVTHVYPQLWGEDLPTLLRAAGYDGSVVVAEDGMEVWPQRGRDA